MRRLTVVALAAALGTLAFAEGAKPAGKPSEMQKRFEKVVKEYVKGESAKTAGAFVVKDDVLNKDWKLKLVRIHTKKIVSLGGDRWFACADLKETEGAKTPVDLDFFVAKADEKWAIEKVVVHKVDGKPRFLYNDKNEPVPAK